MAKIKYAVVGIDQNSLGNLIGTLARGEVDGEAEAVVLPAPVPVAYSIVDGLVKDARVQVKEVPFSTFLADAVTKERRRIIKASVGEKLIEDVVGKMVPENG